MPEHDPESGFGYTEDSPLLIGAPASLEHGGRWATEAAFEPAIIAPPSDRTEEAIPGFAPRRWYKGLGVGFWIATGWVVLWILLAIFASVLPIQNPNAISPSCIGTYAPSSQHLLGCDAVGQDNLSRIIYGARVSLIVGFASIAMGLAVGGTLGLFAGYFRGWFDEVMTIISNVFLSFPYLVLALLIVDFIGRSLLNVTVVIAIVAWPVLYRVVRAATIDYTQRDYVLAARALGSKPTRLLRTLLLPDVIPSAITYGLLGVGLAIVGEGALSFLGLSVPVATPTWGNMIASGVSVLLQSIWPVLVPAVTMFLFILAINFMGDRLRSLLDVRQGVL